VLVLVSGSMAGFLGGMLGLGGGILLAPMLLYAPGAVGLEGPAVKEIMGLTMVQGLAGGLSGLARHQSFGFVSWRLVWSMGVPLGAAALIGALVSSRVPDGVLLGLFASMALIAAALAFVRGGSAVSDGGPEEKPVFNVSLTLACGAAVGLAGGMVGQAGGFLLIPLMIYVLRIPTRFAIGSNLGIILFPAVAGLAGKLGTAQVPLLLAIALVGGTVPGAMLGSLVSRRVRPRALRYALAGIVTAAALGIWLDIFL
jgi:uncharacterized membrane protein YfcA